jgi:sugar/nucleoside kinase (ribokinase family)
MPPDPALTRLDLLLVGGLTVDRFPDGSTIAGGSVLHASRAARATGARVGAIVSAGPEPEAAAATRELADLAYLRVDRVPRSIGFDHRATGGRRELRFTGSAGSVTAPWPALDPRIVLHAPVADELGTRVDRAAYPGAAHAAILQGWLRLLRPDEEVEPLPLDGLPAALRADLATLDLLVASSEDLAVVASEPAAQLAAMRDALGSHPALVVTDGERGAWLDAASGHAPGCWHVAVPRLVEDVPSVGAGDAFAALILLPAWPAVADRAFLGGRAERAMRGVADMLEKRRR